MASELANLALRRFEAFYGRLDEAIDLRDIDLIGALVAEREGLVEQLIASYRGESIPEPVRDRLAARELDLRERLAALHTELEGELAAQRQRNSAMKRYTRGG